MIRSRHIRSGLGGEDRRSIRAMACVLVLVSLSFPPTEAAAQSAGARPATSPEAGSAVASVEAAARNADTASSPASGAGHVAREASERAAGGDQAARVDSIFAEWDRPESPGCMLGVIRDGRFIYRRGYGSANLDYGIPLSEESVFYLASVSKQFVAASIALAARQGHISLDDPVRRWIPDLPEYERPVTIRQMIHHTSGIRDYLGLMSLAGMGYDESHPDAEIVELITRQRELNFAPGDEYLYSNSGYFLLAEIIERATGRSLREYARANIFEPLGMTGTHFHDEPRHVLPNRVFSYSPDDDRPEGVRISYLLNFDKVGSGGLYSSLEDLIRWDRNFYDNRLGGGEAFLDLLHTRGVLTNGDTLEYAFGLSVSEHRGLRMVGHGGSMMGFRTAILRFPDQRFSVICLCNVGDADAPALARRVADVYLEDEFPRRRAFVSDEMGSDADEDEAGDEGDGTGAAPTPGRAALRALAGDYHSPELRVTYSLGYDDGELVLRRPEGGDRRLEPSGTDAFRAGGWTLRFERDDAGRATAFRLTTGRVRHLRFERR